MPANVTRRCEPPPLQLPFPRLLATAAAPADVVDVPAAAAPLPLQVRRLLLREIRILRSLPRHPCVVTLLDAFRSHSSGRPHLVFEHMERSLHKVRG